jgi:hypothetical protein
MLWTATSVHAQTSLSLGAHVAGGSFARPGTPARLEQPEAASFGGGFGAHAAFSFGDRFRLLLSAEQLGQGVTTQHSAQRDVDVLAQMPWLEFGTGTAYLTVGLSSITASSPSTLDASFDRLGATTGVTGRWPVGSKLALEVGALTTYGTFEDVDGKRRLFLYRAFLGASSRLVGRD